MMHETETVPAAISDPTGVLARLRAANAGRPRVDLAQRRREIEERHQRDLAWIAASKTVIGDDDEDAEPVEPVKRTRKASAPDDALAGLLTLNQAAAYLNITDEQIAAFIKDGTLDYINVGRGTKRPRIRFTKQDLDAFIEHRRQKEVPCLSTSTRNPRSTTTPSKSVVIGFTARRAVHLARKPKPSKP